MSKLYFLKTIFYNGHFYLLRRIHTGSRNPCFNLDKFKLWGPHPPIIKASPPLFPFPFVPAKESSATDLSLFLFFFLSLPQSWKRLLQFGNSTMTFVHHFCTNPSYATPLLIKNFSINCPRGKNSFLSSHTCNGSPEGPIFQPCLSQFQSLPCFPISRVLRWAFWGFLCEVVSL